MSFKNFLRNLGIYIELSEFCLLRIFLSKVFLGLTYLLLIKEKKDKKSTLVSFSLFWI